MKNDDPRNIPGLHGQYMTPQYVMSRKNNQSVPNIPGLKSRVSDAGSRGTPTSGINSSIFQSNVIGIPSKHYIYDTYSQ